MRTILEVEDDLMQALKERAHREGVPLEQMVARTLQRGLDADQPAARRTPFRARTFAMGEPLVPSLDKSLSIAAALEDEERTGWSSR